MLDVMGYNDKLVFKNRAQVAGSSY